MYLKLSLFTPKNLSLRLQKEKTLFSRLFLDMAKIFQNFMITLKIDKIIFDQLKNLQMKFKPCQERSNTFAKIINLILK